MITNALEYARRHVYFWQESPISGQFDERKYPFLKEPLLSLDNIDAKETVTYGPAQSMKSVFLQIATAYRLAVHQKTVLIACQSDDDAKDFSQVKLNPFLERIPNIERMQTRKHTIGMWTFANHDLIVAGCGINAQNSKSAPYVHTDEGHLMKPGTLAALTDRSGQRWNRHALHVTTAADAGTEVDTKFHQGSQSEWHNRCIHCNELFQPLWEDDARKEYNGHRIFQWDDDQSETATLDSIRIVCPHCDKEIANTPRNRVLLDEGADYVAMNPNADKSTLSFRWNALASRFKPLRDLLSIYLKAMDSLRFADLKPYENWRKKQLVQTWNNEVPQVGIANIGRDHVLSQIEVVKEDLLIGSVDVQSKDGLHFWCQCDVWHPNGDSKRVDYVKLFTFDDVRAWQLRHNIPTFDSKIHRHPSFAIDEGHLQRDVYAACAKYGWLALKSGDEEGFQHEIKPGEFVDRPWSRVRRGDSLLGKQLVKDQARYCATRLWSKPRIYPIMYALKNGETPKKFSVATDFNPVFVEQLHSYIPAGDKNKKTGVDTKTYWKKVKQDDHGFVTSCQSLVLATIHGQYPLPNI